MKHQIALPKESPNLPVEFPKKKTTGIFQRNCRRSILRNNQRGYQGNHIEMVKKTFKKSAEEIPKGSTVHKISKEL